jgi:dolichol-phosphate mannosyltransferase
MPTLSVITAFLNEEANLPEFRRRVCEVLDEGRIDAEIVLVDDHSTDGSASIAKQWLAEDPRVKYVRLSRNCGSHAALTAGLAHSTGESAVLLAADLQDPPETIPELMEKWREGYDVVWAVRAARKGVSWRTRMEAAIFYWIMRRLALPEMPAKGADFVLVGRKVVDAYNAISEKHTSFGAMLMWMGFRQTWIEYVKQARQAGRSKWTLRKKLKLFVDSIVSFSYVPIRLMSLLGFLMALCGFVYALVVIVGRLTGFVVAGTGFAALMTVLLVGQGSILLMLGILGEYLWRTFDESRGRPRFIVEEYVDGGTSPETPAKAREASERESGKEDRLDRETHHRGATDTE